MAVQFKKFADRISGPVFSILLHVAAVLALIHWVVFQSAEPERDVQVQVVELPDVPEVQPEPPRPEELPRDDAPLAPSDDHLAVLESPLDDRPAREAPDLAGLAVHDAPSPVVLQGLFAGRSAPARSDRLRRFAGGHGERIAEAVLRSLRWLASQQHPDGYWGEVSRYNQSWHTREWSGPMVNEQRVVRLTALCLLAYLSHGDTPQSGEFGRTVDRAIRYLLSQQHPESGLFVPLTNRRPERGAEDLGVYAHGQATYALAEAYALTRAPALRRPLERALRVIIDGQLESGAWGNWYEQNIADSAATSWQIQAMKAAQAAGLTPPGLEQALERAEEGIRYLYRADGSWYYRRGEVLVSPRDGGPILSGAMVFSLQLLGHAQHPLVLAGLRNISAHGVTDWASAWENPINRSLPAAYEWYYNTQAVFQRGGSRWTAWNNAFAPLLLENQHPEGWWMGIGQTSDEEKIYSTSLCSLSLQVYYRILPGAQQSAPRAPKIVFDDDVRVTIRRR